jgi:uncharacterized protein YecE (DUF72 family)
MKKVRQLVPELDDRFRYAVEVRYRTWFQDLAYNFFTDNNICMVWSQLAELRTPPIVTTDFLYLKFRSIDEKNFGKIQKDRVMEMKKWTSKVKRMLKEEGRGRNSINIAIVSANNHYAGFGPGTANIFRKMVGLPETAWSKEDDDKSHLHSSSQSIQDHNSKQSTISDFME